MARRLPTERPPLGESRRWLIVRRTILATAALAIAAGGAVAGEPVLVVDDRPKSVHDTMLGDAALADTAFVDNQTGWAVGDRGVIWHTADGGQTWQLQSSNTTARLDSVFFLDARRGWAAGGSLPPYRGASRGVLLHTVDGGRTWQALRQPMLPALRSIKFFDSARGVALGDASPLAASGVFATQDGGQTWRPLTTDRRGQWLAGDFLAVDTGAVAGAVGQFASIMRHRVAHGAAGVSSLRSYRALRLVPPAAGWLVGDGGLVMTTGDLGRSWQTPPAELPEYVTDYFDFYAVAVRGPRVWVAGAPGSRVFHSPDGGQTWQAQTTGQHVPLRSLAFIDDQRGWAVGDLGTILATQDGGHTWNVQRAGGKRTALLALFADETDVPLELLAKCGGEEGYLAAVALLHPQADAADVLVRGSPAEARNHAAIVTAGATASDAAWRFPLPASDLALEPGDLVARLNDANDGRAIERLRAHLVRQLRMWRPDVVVTHHRQHHLAWQPIELLMSQMVEDALSAAADPTQYPELATAAGLGAWQVKRVYGLLPTGSEGDTRLATGQYAARLGATLADWVGPARQLLQANHVAPPNIVELQLLAPESIDTPIGNDLFRGIHLAPGSDARRRLANLPSDDLDRRRQMAMRRRQMQALIQRSPGNAAWAGSIENLLADLDDETGGELLYQLADGYRAAGRLDSAADTFALVARRWPDHPLAEPALVWLVKFYGSSETAHRASGERASNVRATTTVEQQRGEVQPASATVASPVGGLSRDDRLRRAVMLGKYLETARPALFAEPNVRCPAVVAQRQLGYANPAKKYFLSLRSLPESDPWFHCAQTEEWLAQPKGLPPQKMLGHCRPTTERPHLDGQLDEPFWNSTDRLSLGGSETNDEAASSAEIRFAYDREFLYLAVRCPKAAGGNYASDDRPRPHDADLTPHDRITFQLDTDRDYTTAWELSVDHRGWTNDACWGDATWNPTWYVAAGGDEQTWTIEAAIPLAELTAERPGARHVWAVAARRTIPRVGNESWSGHADDDTSPERFGLLIFD